MVAYCTVHGCNNSSGLKPNLRFHRFPRSPALCALWVKAVNREGWQPKLYSRMCSDHFQESDYTPTRRLKAEAIPSKYSPPKSQQTSRNIVLIPCNCISNSDVPVHNFQVEEEAVPEPAPMLPEFHNCGIHTDTSEPVISLEVPKKEVLLELDSDVCSSTYAPNSQSTTDQQREQIKVSPDLNSSIYSNNTFENDSQMLVDQSLVKIEVLPDVNTSMCYELDSQMMVDQQVENTNNEFATEKSVIYRRSKGTQTAPKFDVLSPQQTEKIVKMKTKIKTLQRTLQRREKQLKAVKDILEQLSVQSTVSANPQDILQEHFTDVMKDLISQELNVTNQPKSGRRYTENIKEFSLTLYSYSPKAYEFVSNFMGLPCLRTIKSWLERDTNPICSSPRDD